MREPTFAVLNALERDAGGLALIWCPDLDLREWLVRDISSYLPVGLRPVQVATVAEALALPDELVFLVPRDEAGTVDDLEGSRDRVFDPDQPRTQPIVLFLLNGGDGQRVLANAPGLKSWLRGNDVDPEERAEIDEDTERQLFEQQTGQTPEGWLAAWRRGAHPHDDEHYECAYRALLLEKK